MDKATFDYVTERAEVLATSPASKAETAEAAHAWQVAVEDADDAAVAAATDALLDYLEGRPHTIDEVIAFGQGPAVQMMGEEAAAQYVEHQHARKEAGAKFCDCPSCTAASEILAKFGRVEL